MFESTSDKILRILIDNDAESVERKFGAIKTAFPSLSQQQIDSVIAELLNEKLIVALYGGNKLIALNVQPHALSRLTTRREITHWQLKWDLVKIAFGYASGFICAWLLK